MTKLNIAIVGYGGIGSFHATNLIQHDADKFDIIGTYDIKEERQRKAIEDGFHAYESFDALLNDARVDVVLVSTPNDSHMNHSIQALKAGKHVICEKPVTLNVEEFDNIIRVAKDTQQIFMVHQNRRWDPDFLVMKEIYENKLVGDIFHIESRVHGANGIPGDWRAMKKHGGGMLLDWGVHLLDQILWMVKEPIKSIHPHLSYVLGNDSDDGFSIEMIFENHLRVIVEVATTNFIPLPRWYVKGYEGTAQIDDWYLNGKIVKRTDLENVTTPKPIQAGAGFTKTMAPPREDAVLETSLPKPNLDHPSFYQNFYEVVKDGAEAIVKNEEVREVMQLIDTIFDQQKFAEPVH